MKNLPSEFLEPSDSIRIPNIMRLLKMDMHHVNGSPDLGGISQAVFKGVFDRGVHLPRNSREGSEFRDYLDSPGIRMGAQLERYAKRKSCGPVEIIGTLNATAMSPVKLKDRKMFLPINSDFDLSESSKNPKPEKQDLPKALNVPKIGILGPVPSKTL
jgi:hypothetical protein